MLFFALLSPYLCTQTTDCYAWRQNVWPSVLPPNKQLLLKEIQNYQREDVVNNELEKMTVKSKASHHSKGQICCQMSQFEYLFQLLTCLILFSFMVEYLSTLVQVWCPSLVVLGDCWKSGVGGVKWSIHSGSESTPPVPSNRSCPIQKCLLLISTTDVIRL